MDKQQPTVETRDISPPEEADGHLRTAVLEGRDWRVALVEAMALWSEPRETYRGREFVYFIGGEAFDWVALAERLLLELDGLVPAEEKEALLFSARLPAGMDESTFKRLLGVEKYRGHLNYVYGVTVELALQLAVEAEVHKRYVSNGIVFRGDLADEACEKIYGLPRSELLERFRADAGGGGSMTLRETREFTYWLFKYRLKRADPARVASDTKKGLLQLQRMQRAPRS
jgi:hypothetical protein